MNTTSTNYDQRLQQIVLRDEIENFLYKEADLLDERKFSEWLDLLSEDIRYWMPLTNNVRYGQHWKGEMTEGVLEYTRESKDLAWFDEGKTTLTQRVRQIETGIHWAEEPLSRVSHLISNVEIVEVAPDLFEPLEVIVRCRFFTYRNRLEDEVDIFVGKRKDTLRKSEGLWKICRREILLDQNVLLAKNLTLFF